MYINTERLKNYVDGRSDGAETKAYSVQTETDRRTDGDIEIVERQRETYCMTMLVCVRVCENK